jgi:hypothetical protein
VALPKQPLSDEEILSTFGPAIWAFLVEPATDPTSLAEICEAANAAEQYAEKRRAARAERTRRPDQPIQTT